VTSQTPNAATGPRSPGSDLVQPMELLYRSHWVGMVRLSYLLIDDHEVAEDIVQEAFVALSQRWGRLKSEDAAVAYLRTSVVNGSRSALRRRFVATRASRFLAAGTVESADQVVIRNDEHRRVLAATGSLPVRQREVVVLRYWVGLSEAEIASTLRVSVGTVKSAASRARKAIQLSLEADDGYGS